MGITWKLQCRRLTRSSENENRRTWWLRTMNLGTTHLGLNTHSAMQSMCPVRTTCIKYLKKKKNLTHSMGSRKEFNSPMLSSKWHPTPVFLPGESHEQRSLMGYSPQGHKESDTTEWLHFTFTFHFHLKVLNMILYWFPGSILCYPISGME